MDKKRLYSPEEVVEMMHIVCEINHDAIRHLCPDIKISEEVYERIIKYDPHYHQLPKNVRDTFESRLEKGFR